MSSQAPPDQLMSQAYQGVSPNSHFLAGELPTSDLSWKSFLLRSSWSVVAHLVGLALFIYIVTRPATIATINKVIQPDVVWLDKPGPGGGGGGGGTKSPEPPKKAEIVPPKAPKVELTKPEPPKPIPQMNIPAVTAPVELPGATTAVPEAVSQGSGTLGGGGTGTGTGVGSGTGSGYGEGFGGGTGGGVYREGNGVTSPVLLKEYKPNYTSEAMRARIQGLVTMEAVVLPDGSVGDVHIVRSLDQQFGLDKEAVNTIKKWHFRPGMRMGQPVSVLIVVEMSFTLR